MPELIPWRELRNLIPYTRQHIRRLELVGRFPRRVRVGPARIAWVRSEVEAWIAARITARDQPRIDFPSTKTPLNLVVRGHIAKNLSQPPGPGVPGTEDLRLLTPPALPTSALEG